MRKPWACLPPIRAELLQARLQPVCEPRRLARRIVEDHHAHGTSLAITHGLERERASTGSRLAERFDDSFELWPGPGSEEGKCDMEAVDPPASHEVPVAPAFELLDGVPREQQSEEEPKRSTGFEGTA